MGKSPSSWNCSKHEEPLKRGAWTDSEDKILCEYIKTHGVGQWGSLPKKAGIKRCGKSCRLRWLNYLRPEIKRGNISPEEEELLIRLHRLLGNRWSLIAGRLPGRTDNEIKNYWNTHLSKRIQMGEFEPKFQKPFQRRDIPSSSNYDEEGVLNNDSYTSQNLPLKTIAVSYRGRVTADVLNYSNNNYELIQDTHDSINKKKRLKAAGDHVLEIDTSKSWCQLLLEDCMGDYQYDRLETITGLQPNSMISTGHGIDDDHQSPSPSLGRSIILQKNHLSSYCNLFDREFPNSRDFNSSYFESFLDMGDMGELPSLPP